MRQPLVNVGSNKRPTYLPSHLCEVKEGQISKLKTNPQQTKAMINFAVRPPDQNANSITSNGFNTLGFNRGNQELVVLPLFDDLSDVSELMKTGTLRN